MQTARCYCGSTTLRFDGPALTVAYCHCADCRRWTGAPVAAFAAFTNTDVTGLGSSKTYPSGARRWNCAACGTPMAAQFPYLPGQTYVPLGIMDQIDDLAPALHCHADTAPPWLHIADDLPRVAGSGRATLNEAPQ